MSSSSDRRQGASGLEPQRSVEPDSPKSRRSGAKYMANTVSSNSR